MAGMDRIEGILISSHSESTSIISQKNILIIAGPNGAGKTTFARNYLLNEADDPTFINADMIAEGLNPFQPERSAFAAGRIMLRMIDEYVRRGESFAFETTLSGPKLRSVDSGVASRRLLDHAMFLASTNT